MWESTPIINYVFEWSPEESEAFQVEMMEAHLAPSRHGLKPVAFMKQRLGAQDYTWVGEFRFWVWEQAGWRVYVSNRKGIGFEVQTGLAKERVREQWDDFRRKIGLI